MASEAKKREVLQLLRDWRAWHTPHGGAMPLDETGLIDAAYGPAGLIQAGQVFEKRHRKLLRETYDYLDHALNILKTADHELWIALHRPYLSDAADSSIVVEWRKKAERGNEDAKGAVELHDLAIRVLAILLYNVDLFVVFPARMTSREEKDVERRNDEYFALYERLRDDLLAGGLSQRSANRQAIRDAAQMSGYSEPRGYEIVRLRTGKAG